jgi:hypothetical protein
MERFYIPVEKRLKERVVLDAFVEAVDKSDAVVVGLQPRLPGL